MLPYDIIEYSISPSFLSPCIIRSSTPYFSHVHFTTPASYNSPLRFLLPLPPWYISPSATYHKEQNIFKAITQKNGYGESKDILTGNELYGGIFWLAFCFLQTPLATLGIALRFYNYSLTKKTMKGCEHGWWEINEHM